MTGAQYRTLNPCEVCVDPREASARLGMPFDFNQEPVRRCMEELQSVVAYRYAWRETKVRLLPDDRCDLGFAEVKSHALSRNLHGCESAVILGVTTGMGVDRMLARQGLLNAGDAFICDALASAAAEALRETAQSRILGARQHRPPFSPGYGDLSLDLQPALLNFLNAGVTLGITLSASFLMKPVKSITAIIGVIHDTDFTAHPQ